MPAPAPRALDFISERDREAVAFGVRSRIYRLRAPALSGGQRRGAVLLPSSQGDSFAVAIQRLRRGTSRCGRTAKRLARWFGLAQTLLTLSLNPATSPAKMTPMCIMAACQEAKVRLLVKTGGSQVRYGKG